MENRFEKVEIMWSSPSFNRCADITAVYAYISIMRKTYGVIIEFDNNRPSSVSVFTPEGHVDISKEEALFLMKLILKREGIKWTS